MKLKKIFAAFAASAVAVSAMSISAFAVESTVAEATLNAQNDSKAIQWQVGVLGTDSVDTVVISGKIKGDGWYGGGGGFGYNSMGGWIQIDFAGTDSFVTVDDEGNLVATLDFKGKHGTVDRTPCVIQDNGDEGIAQLGWWWGAGDEFYLTDISVNGASIMGVTAPDPAAAAETEAEGDEAAAEGDETEAEDAEEIVEDVDDFDEEAIEVVDDTDEEVVELIAYEDGTVEVAESEVETVDEPAPVETEVAVVVEPVAEETTVYVETAAPAPDSTTSPAKTGNAAVAAVASVLALAGAAAFASRKK